jgi:hypothetical protein
MGTSEMCGENALVRKDPQTQESSALRQRRKSAYMVNARLRLLFAYRSGSEESRTAAFHNC